MLKMHGDLPFKCSQDLPRIEEPLRIEITLGFLKGPLYIGRRGGGLPYIHHHGQSEWWVTYLLHLKSLYMVHHRRES